MTGFLRIGNVDLMLEGIDGALGVTSSRVFRLQPSHGKVVTEGLTNADGSATIDGPERSI